MLAPQKRQNRQHGNPQLFFDLISGHLQPDEGRIVRISAGGDDEGGPVVGEGGSARALPPQAAGVLSEGEHVVIAASAQEARLILVAGRPLHEPIVQYGPFVMNTREEIEQAIQDYQRGEFAKAPA